MKPGWTAEHQGGDIPATRETFTKACGCSVHVDGDVIIGRVRCAKHPRRRQPAATVRHTSCRYCGLDIEGVTPFKRGEWLDRGGNRHCNDGRHQHAPVKDMTALEIQEGR